MPTVNFEAEPAPLTVDLDRAALVIIDMQRDFLEPGGFGEARSAMTPPAGGKKKLSKKYYGTSHVLSKEEAKFIFERGCDELIVGSGQMNNVRLSPEAEAYFKKKDCKVLLQPTPGAIQVFNKSHAKKIGLFHVTC